MELFVSVTHSSSSLSKQFKLSIAKSICARVCSLFLEYRDGFGFGFFFYIDICERANNTRDNKPQRTCNGVCMCARVREQIGNYTNERKKKKTKRHS